MNHKEQVDHYYEELDLADSLRKSGRAREALQAATTNITRVPSLVAENLREYGNFAIGSIPPIEVGLTLAAILGEGPTLQWIRTMVDSIPELSRWREVVARAEQDFESVRAIRQLVSQEPGVVQSTLGKRLGIDGRRASDLCARLAQAGLMRREKTGSKYLLFA